MNVERGTLNGGGRRSLTIRARLTLWYTGILAATLLILGGVSYGLLERSLWQDVDSTLEGVARAMTLAAEQQAGPVLPPETEEFLRRFFGPEFADRFFQFLDPRGRLDPRRPRFRGDLLNISPKALENATQGFATFDTIPGSGPYPVRVLTFPVMVRGRLVNVLQVGMALEGLHRARRSFLWTLAAVLPLGLKRLLEIARALAAAPTLLLLDEPASGLDAVETERLQEMILALKDAGITLLLVEHDMGLTMEVADEIAVLNYGRLIADGPPRAIQKHPEVIAAYLGTDWQT